MNYAQQKTQQSKSAFGFPMSKKSETAGRNQKNPRLGKGTKKLVTFSFDFISGETILWSGTVYSFALYTR